MNNETSLIHALRRGDDDAFRSVVAEYHPALVRTARRFVHDPGVAEEVTQETWLAVVRNIGSFEERSTFKTWLFAILANQARSRRERDVRHATYDERPPSDNGRWFQSPDDEEPGHWRQPPADWALLPEAQLLGVESTGIAHRAIDGLPDAQRQVITLRDVEGFSGVEVSAVLGITEANERVLLHRARAKVRAALEVYFEGASI
jgi:RNA polymerase sigma-70 factor, ECF subfamily